MIPLLISGYNVSIPVERASLKVNNTDNHTENLTFRPPDTSRFNNYRMSLWQYFIRSNTLVNET